MTVGTTGADDGGGRKERGDGTRSRTNKNENKVRNHFSRSCGIKLATAPAGTGRITNPFTMGFSIISLLLFGVFLAIFLLITVPLTGGLVRLRANYNPKGLQLDPEDGVQPHTGPVITSFFVMLYRVRNLEVSEAVCEGFHRIAQRYY
jgi:hypothetical protein